MTMEKEMTDLSKEGLEGHVGGEKRVDLLGGAAEQ